MFSWSGFIILKFTYLQHECHLSLSSRLHLEWVKRNSSREDSFHPSGETSSIINGPSQSSDSVSRKAWDRHRGSSCWWRRIPPCGLREVSWLHLSGCSPFGPAALWLEEQTCGHCSATALQRLGSSDLMDMVTLVAVRRSYIPVPLLFYWPRERVDLDPLYLEWLI